jgi:tRNA(fMet)-specific endonuclease VapC
MVIILDADVIIRGEKGAFELREWLQAHADDQFLVAAITIAELWHGVERATGKQRAVRERYLRSMLVVLPVLPYTEQTAYVHARLWAGLQASGKMIGYYDLMVAATAIEHDCEVATFNERHFSVVPGLKTIVPA